MLSVALVESLNDRMLDILELRGHFRYGRIPMQPLDVLLLIEFEHVIDLIDFAGDRLIQYTRDEKILHFVHVDVQLAGDELDANLRVRLDQFDEHLGAYGSKKNLDVLANELIVHDRLPVAAQDRLELFDVVVLVGADEIGHRLNLGIGLVRLCFLRIERIDGRTHEHVGQDEVLQARGAPRRA